MTAVTADFEVKTMRKVRQRVEIAAAGGYMKGIRDRDKRVVRWDPDGRNVRAGPGIKLIILLITIKTIMTIIRIILITIFVFQEQDFMSLSGKRPGHTCSLKCFG